MDVEAWIADLGAAYELVANKPDARAMEAYMKGIAPFYGVKATPAREIMKDHLKLAGAPSPFNPAFYRALWAQPCREMHHCGVDLLRKQAKHVAKGDIALIEELILTKSWWDTVDGLAIWVCGPYFQKFPEQRNLILDRWAIHPDIWLRRSAIIFQNQYKQHTDQARLFRYIRLNLGSKQFFINKAIGWALRDYSKTDPTAVIAFANAEPLAGLSRREALRLL